jgi:hypothetical protein
VDVVISAIAISAVAPHRFRTVVADPPRWRVKETWRPHQGLQLVHRLQFFLPSPMPDNLPWTAGISRVTFLKRSRCLSQSFHGRGG